MTSPLARYPDIVVCLSEVDGNAVAVIAAVERALRRGRVRESTIAEFRAEAKSGDYDQLLQTCLRWVAVS